MRQAVVVTAFLLASCLPGSAAKAQSKDLSAANAAQKSSSVSAKSTDMARTNALDANNQESAANHPSTTPASRKGPNLDIGVSDAPSKTSADVPVASLPASSSESDPVTPSVAAKPAPAPVNIYRVGVGDVLDVQLLNAPTRDSTLYTVLAGGLLEYPLAVEAVKVDGLTTEEIGWELNRKIKIYEKPQVVVTVREYASHHVIVTGLVHDPGTKALRREAVPLFVVLAESLPRADAARAVIMRTGSPSQTIDLADTTATTVLIYPNDIIRLIAAPPPAPQFFYIAGQIVSPGQKDFHHGLTLTQAIFACGGVTRLAGSKVKVMRQGADGRLSTTEYNLKKIEQGKDPDPRLEAGDRIDVGRGGWLSN